MKTIFKFKTYSDGIRDYYIASGKEEKIWMRLCLIKVFMVEFIALMLLVYLIVTALLFNVLPRKIIDNSLSSGFIYDYYAIIFLICVIRSIVTTIRFYHNYGSQIAFEEVVDGKIIKYKRVYFLPYESSFSNFISYICNPPWESLKGVYVYTIGINENNEMKCKCGACGEIFSITNNTLYTLCPHCYTQNWIQALTDPHVKPHLK